MENKFHIHIHIHIYGKQIPRICLDRISLEYKEMQGNTRKNGGRRGGVGGGAPRFSLYFLRFPCILKEILSKQIRGFCLDRLYIYIYIYVYVCFHTIL